MNTHKILANAVVFAGFLAIPFIPFIVFLDSTFFPFITGKNFVFRILTEIMLSAWVVLAVLDPAYRPKKSYLVGAFTALLAVITLSAIFGENPAKSFWSNFERMEGVITYFHLFAYFIVAGSVLTVRSLWEKYLNLHVLAGVIMAIYGVMQWFGTLEIVQDGSRVNGTLGNAAYLGAYAFFNIFLAGFLFAREKFATSESKIRAGLYGTAILLHVFVLYHTATRGAMLGLIAGTLLAALLIAFFERNQKAVRMGAVGVLVAVALFVGGFLALRDAQFVKESPVLSRFASISFSEQTTKSRFMVWNMALQGFQEKPVLGWGMENFNYVFNKYYDPKMYGQEQWFDRAHNVFFDWLIAGGLLGLLAYLSLFVCALYCIWRRAQSLSVIEKSILTGLLGGYFFQNLFVFDNLTSLIYFATILAYIDTINHEPVKEGKVQNKKTAMISDDTAFMVSGGAVVAALVLMYAVNYSGIMQNLTLTRALSEKGDKGFLYNLDLFREAISYGSFGTSEAREQLAEFTMGALGKPGGLSDVQKQFVVVSASELEQQAKASPRDTRYQVFLGSFLVRAGAIDDGISYLEKALTLSPQKQAILFEIGSAYYNKKDLVKALEYFKKAYELAPEYDLAENYYIQILVESNKLNEIEAILKAHIERSPRDVQAHIKLGALYNDLGRKTDAIHEVETAIDLDPTFKEKGDAFLRELKR